MLKVESTWEFDRWLRDLKDRRSRARILMRLERLSLGNLGDVKPIGSGLLEMRINTGPGYRVYFLKHGESLVLLLCGGDKSTQQKDIRVAHQLAADWRAIQGRGGSQ